MRRHTAVPIQSLAMTTARRSFVPVGLDKVVAASLRLFSAVLAPTPRTFDDDDAINAINTSAIPLGFVLSPAAAAVIHADQLGAISALIGISGDEANAAFHKSWMVVETASDLQLRLQQIVHYLTTYGFEAAGVYDERTVFIPPEVLNIPALREGIRLVLVDAISEEELCERALRLASGVALKEETADDLLAILSAREWPDAATMVSGVGNRELRAKLYDYFGLAPTEPVEFLRFVVQKLTGQSLLIKNDELLAAIAATEVRVSLSSLLDKAPSDLASIFLRFKPIFLALKKVSSDKTFFNRLRKRAVKIHKPLPQDRLNTVTASLKKGEPLSGLDEALKRANIFRKIRLACALKYRTDDSQRNAIVYRVRNGKAWATDFSFDDHAAAQRALEIVLDSVCGDLAHLDGQRIYIPPHVGYALPATEKAFTGHFPSGSFIEVPEDMIVGVHWYDAEGYRIDLDLSTISAYGKVGWDADYRTASRDVLFSGDMTAAPRPRGASELFYIKKASHDPKIMLVNFYNYQQGVTVDAKIVVAHERPSGSFRAYAVDPNKILAVAPLTITSKQAVLGLLANVDGRQRFYFAQAQLGRSISSSSKVYVGQTRDFYAAKMLNAISLNDMLVRVGAVMETTRPVSGDFVDLSPENLTRTSVLDLLRPAKT